MFCWPNVYKSCLTNFECFLFCDLVIVCETVQKLLYLITFLFPFQFHSLCFQWPVVTVSILVTISALMCLFFFWNTFYVIAARIDSDSSKLASASYICLARVPGIEQLVTLYVCYLAIIWTVICQRNAFIFLHHVLYLCLILRLYKYNFVFI